MQFAFFWPIPFQQRVCSAGHRQMLQERYPDPLFTKWTDVVLRSVEAACLEVKNFPITLEFDWRTNIRRLTSYSAVKKSYRTPAASRLRELGRADVL